MTEEKMGIDNTWYDRDGHVITEEQGLAFLNDEHYRLLVRTQVLDKQDIDTSFFVSTVWFGRNLGTKNSPVIFETLVRNKRDHEMACLRAGTVNEALDNHADLVSEYADLCGASIELNIHRSSLL